MHWKGERRRCGEGQPPPQFVHEEEHIAFEGTGLPGGCRHVWTSDELNEFCSSDEDKDEIIRKRSCPLFQIDESDTFQAVNEITFKNTTSGQPHRANYSHFYPPIATIQPMDKTGLSLIIDDNKKRRLGDFPACSCGADRSTVQSPLNWQELGEPNSIGDISEHGDETDSNEVGDMPLAFQPSHCYSMGAAIPT